MTENNISNESAANESAANDDVNVPAPTPFSTFSTTALAGDRVLVTGNDLQGVARHTILSAAEHNALRLRDDQKDAVATYDKAVEDFFAPLTQAADAVAEARKPVIDPDFFVVLQEGTEGVPPVREELHHLGKDTVILRMLERGDTSRLLWVGDDIEITARTV